MSKCNKCGKTMDDTQFYTYKDGRKTELCKKCLTMHIDNYNPETFLWLLEKMDVPYIKEEWDVLLNKAFAKDPTKINGMSVFGKYLSKMKLKQWKDYGWADSEKLVKLKEERTDAELAELERQNEYYQKQFEEGRICESEYKTLVSTAAQAAAQTTSDTNPYLGPNNPYNEAEFISQDELPDPGAALSQEDKIALAVKWGTLYKPNEWIELERMYTEMENSFNIQDADTANTLTLLCKTNLKMNQAIDNGDVEGFQKLSKVSESLRKSAKFTAAQKKEEEHSVFDSVGAIVAFCEKEGGRIPRFDYSVDLDRVDAVIKDMKNYTKSLIYEDSALARQIEEYLKKREAIEFHPEDEEFLTDKDFIDYNNSIEGLKDEDESI